MDALREEARVIGLAQALPGIQNPDDAFEQNEFAEKLQEARHNWPKPNDETPDLLPESDELLASWVVSGAVAPTIYPASEQVSTSLIPEALSAADRRREFSNSDKGQVAKDAALIASTRNVEEEKLPLPTPKAIPFAFGGEVLTTRDGLTVMPEIRNLLGEVDPVGLVTSSEQYRWPSADLPKSAVALWIPAPDDSAVPESPLEASTDGFRLAGEQKSMTLIGRTEGIYSPHPLGERSIDVAPVAPQAVTEHDLDGGLRQIANRQKEFPSGESQVLAHERGAQTSISRPDREVSAVSAKAHDSRPREQIVQTLQIQNLLSRLHGKLENSVSSSLSSKISSQGDSLALFVPKPEIERLILALNQKDSQTELTQKLAVLFESTSNDFEVTLLDRFSSPQKLIEPKFQVDQQLKAPVIETAGVYAPVEVNARSVGELDREQVAPRVMTTIADRVEQALDAQPMPRKITMSLYPAELGRVSIELLRSGMAVTARIEASDEKLANALDQQRQALVRDRGVGLPSIERVEVVTASDRGHSASDFSQSAHQGQQFGRDQQARLAATASDLSSLKPNEASNQADAPQGRGISSPEQTLNVVI